MPPRTASKQVHQHLAAIAFKYHPFLSLPLPQRKAAKRLGDAVVLEIVEVYYGDTYREVYTVKFAERVYVLHVFQKQPNIMLNIPTRPYATVTPASRC
jgi:phage-related protein